MPREICKLNFTAVDDGEGVLTSGSVEFDGNGEDMAAVLAGIYKALGIKVEQLMALTLVAAKLLDEVEDAK